MISNDNTENPSTLQVRNTNNFDTDIAYFGLTIAISKCREGRKKEIRNNTN